MGFGHVRERAHAAAWSPVRVKVPARVWAVAMGLVAVKVKPSVMVVVNVMETGIVKG